MELTPQRKIIYYVASSLDGYIAGPNADISQFIQKGEGVTQYWQDLQAMDTVIMGRHTYEFGYQYGLQAGQPAYPHMKHYIFSSSLQFEQAHEQVKVCPLDIQLIHDLKQQEGADIYLCGGGTFAGWLLEEGLIDQVKLKLNPIVLGGGTRLFGPSTKTAVLDRQSSVSYEDGMQIITFNLSA